MVGPGSDEAPAGERDSLPALERVNRIILASSSLETMLSDVLDAMLDLLDCDRAWLLHPCDPAAEWFSIPMERTRPEWPGAGATAERLPMVPFARRAMAAVLEQPGAHRWDGVHDKEPLDDMLERRFSVKAMMQMAVRTRVGEL